MQLLLEGKFVNSFDTDTASSNISKYTHIKSFQVRLLRLGWILSYRGGVKTLTFSSELTCNVYDDFVIMDLKLIGGTERKCKYVKRSAFKIKNDIFAGKYVTCKIGNINIDFRTNKDNIKYFGM